MASILTYLQNRLREKTTWAGLFMVASAWGFNLTAEQVAALSFLGMALAGAPGDSIQRLQKPKSCGHKDEHRKITKEDLQRMNEQYNNIKKSDADKSLTDIIDSDNSM